MTKVDLDKLAGAQSRYADNKATASDKHRIFRASLEYLAQSRVTDAEKQAAFDWLDESFIDEKQSELEDVFSIGVPPGTDFSEIHKALRHIEVIRAARMQQGRDPDVGHMEAEIKVLRQMVKEKQKKWWLDEEWKLVPVEPTKEMIHAGFEAAHPKHATGYYDIYSAMIAAAPEGE